MNNFKVERKYPPCAQFYSQEEFDYESFLSNSAPHGKLSGSSLTDLQNAHWHLMQFAEALKMTSEKNKNGLSIAYTAMTIFHICQKHY